MPGSTHTSLKVVRKSEEAVSKHSGQVREVDAADFTNKSRRTHIDCLFDLPPHCNRILQNLVSRYPHHVVSKFCEIPIAALIMLAVRAARLGRS